MFKVRPAPSEAVHKFNIANIKTKKNEIATIEEPKHQLADNNR